MEWITAAFVLFWFCIYSTYYYYLYFTQKFDVLVTWDWLGLWWWLSFPDIILYCEPKYFLISVQSGFFYNVQTFIFKNTNSRLFTRKGKAKHEGYYLQIGCWNTECQTSFTPCLHFFIIAWLRATEECNVHICIGHDGVLSLFQAVLLLAAVQTQTVVLKNQTQCKLINTVTVS